MDLITEDPPLTVLDIGAGYGFWGYMLSAYLEFDPLLAAVEMNPKCVDRLERIDLYDHIWAEDATHCGKWSIVNYDLAILSHVVEHIEKLTAIRLIEYLKTKVKKIIIICPEGEALVEHEEIGYSHVSQWSAADFNDLKFGARSIAFSHRAGRVVSAFERLYFKLKGLKRGGVVVAWWEK